MSEARFFGERNDARAESGGHGGGYDADVGMGGFLRRRRGEGGLLLLL